MISSMVGARRLAATFEGHAGRVFLEENGETWTVGRLLACAADIACSIPADAGSVVAVRSHTAAFVVASLVGVWQAGRSPLLVDPQLTTEPAGLRDRRVRLPVIAPAAFPDPWADVAVEETGRAPVVPRFPAPHHTEVIFFTSGSTGTPKVVRKRAYQLGEQHVREAPWLGLDGPVSVVSLVPAFHILGYIYGFDMPACGGGRTVFARGVSPQGWVDLIRDRAPGLVVGVPSHYRLMAQVLSAPLPKAVYVCSGGPLDPAAGDEFQRRSGSRILQVYGSTETGGIAVRHGSDPFTPFPGLEWRSREPDGRLEIRSPWQDRPRDWHTTDDVAAADGDRMEFLGRADSIVKVGGRRFSTREIVLAALAAPGVEQAHAVVYERFGEAAVALFVVPQKDRPAAAADVRSSLAGRLAPFKVPRTIQVIPELPARGIGKVDEEALRAIITPEAGSGATASNGGLG